MRCRWIVCAADAHWLNGVHRFASLALPSEAAQLTVSHCASVTVAEKICMDDPKAIILWARTEIDDNWLSAMSRLRLNSNMQIVVLPSCVPFDSFESVEMKNLLLELGATVVVESYRQFPAVCRLARRYWAKNVNADPNLIRSIWQSLPWSHA